MPGGVIGNTLVRRGGLERLKGEISKLSKIAKKYHVYVIQSSEGFRYTGMTEDLQIRLEQHNNHSLTFHTKRGNNW